MTTDPALTAQEPFIPKFSEHMQTALMLYYTLQLVSHVNKGEVHDGGYCCIGLTRVILQLEAQFLSWGQYHEDNKVCAKSDDALQCLSDYFVHFGVECLSYQQPNMGP